MDKMYYRPKELAKYLGMGESTIFKKMKSDPDFPRPTKVSQQVTVWDIRDIDNYMARKRGSTIFDGNTEFQKHVDEIVAQAVEQDVDQRDNQAMTKLALSVVEKYKDKE